jgi:hypothetical protein
VIFQSIFSVHKAFFIGYLSFLQVEDMDLKSMLTSKWFTRLALLSWIICGASIIVVFKNMEFIVHGQLYDFGLIFSAEWADSYRVLTWLIFLCVGVPTAFSGIALVSSFLSVEEIPARKHIPQRTGPPRGATKVASPQAHPAPKVHPTQPSLHKQQPAKEPVRRADIGNCIGILCPECKKVFGRALVMLDFRSGSNRMVSVCPYCNHVLGSTNDEEDDDDFRVASRDKEIMR